LEYANVILTVNDSSRVAGVVTNKDGFYELTAGKNKLNLAVSMLGFETYNKEIEVNGANINVEDIVLKTSALQLNEAVVTAKLIEQQADRFIMNIQGNLTTAGKNTAEILSLAPSVWVDKQKGISINGKSDIKVMVNDRIMNMSSDELLNYLETIKAEDIQSIGIITDPGAEYEANSNSGIIHIKLKKNRIGGLTGSASMGIRLMRSNLSYLPSLNLNYRHNRLSVYGSLYYNKINWESDGSGNTYFLNKDNEVKYKFENSDNSDYWRGNIGSVYELSDKHDIGFTFEFQNSLRKEQSENISELIENSLLTRSTYSPKETDSRYSRYELQIQNRHIGPSEDNCLIMCG